MIDTFVSQYPASLDLRTIFVTRIALCEGRGVHDGHGEPAVTGNPLFSDLLKHRVTFYRTRLPSYASVVHPGGAPEWVVRKWMDVSVRPETAADRMPASAPIPKSIEEDLRRLKSAPSTEDEAVASLLGLFGEDITAELDDLVDDLTYPV